jgi:CelD/BcsL family acetyltransferase involved in cellulose biosynthesis
VNVYRIDPLADSRWSALVERSPQSSIFHTGGWLDAVRRTYGYLPMAYTTSAPAEDLTNAVVVSQVRSWLTGSRLVSGPFADHCDPLFSDAADLDPAVEALQRDVRGGAWKCLELRPTVKAIPPSAVLVAHRRYCLHVLELGPSVEALRAACHKDSIQRKIQRAERESLRIESGRSKRLLTAFYGQLCATRRRHGIPPQPLSWFRNLVDCLAESVLIRVAFKDDRPIGAIVTIRHRDTMVYKYGASDATMHSAGAMPFLMWNAIVDAKNAGMRRFDFGRSDLDQHGLITFKDRFGASRKTITYLRYSHRRQTRSVRFAARLAGAIIRQMPDSALRVAGRLLYRHVG